MCGRRAGGAAAGAPGAGGARLARLPVFPIGAAIADQRALRRDAGGAMALAEAYHRRVAGRSDGAEQGGMVSMKVERNGASGRGRRGRMALCGSLGLALLTVAA